jgi:hypothetical protein
MSFKKHGFTIGLIRLDDENIVSMSAMGTLHDEDYKTMVPIIESLFKGIDSAKVKILFDASKLEGWDLKAAWDDFKFGLDHSSDFSKIAFLGDKKWEQIAAKIGNWFIPGEVKYFENEHAALQWLS